MRRFLIIAMSIPFVCWTPACGNGGSPAVIEDLPVDEEIQLSILSGEIDAVFDDRGIPHIYGSDIADVVRVQGYLMARDRMAQMEFLRRAIEGRLAEVAGNLDPTMLESDRSTRLLGLHRQARAIYDSLEEGSPGKVALDAFGEGVTAWMAQIKAGNERFPGILADLLRPELLTDWTGVNTLSLARYQTYDLSFTGWDDADWSLAASGIAESFPADSPDERLAARAGMFHDLWPFAPAAEAYTSEGFFGLGVRRARRGPEVRERWLPDRELLLRARPFFQALKRLRDLVAGEDRGSNNWIVRGAHTASGNAILANDPHLGLASPPIWWMNHLNTARAGGDWDTMGVSFAGIPGITLGFNRNVAWGATVSNYDVTDVYQEVITPGAPGEPDTVLFNGQQVPIEVITETILVGGAQPEEIQIEVVPHHGPIIPETRKEDSALSFKWTGIEPSDELAAFVGFGISETVDDVATYMQNFEVGGQNIVAADSNGDIFWTTRCHVPVRDPRAMDYDPATRTGFSPSMVLPGTGEYEWIGRLADEDIPSARNPEEGWLSTANQDPVGTTADGNPFNDEHYLGSEFDLGLRQARLHERLGQLVQAGGITPEDMSQVQADAHSALGAKLAAVLVAALDRAGEEHASADTHPDLSAVVAEAGAAGMTKLAHVRDRLNAWTSHLTPAAVEGDPAAGEIADSVATTLFNATITRLARLALDDEIDRIGVRPTSQYTGRTLQWAMLEPERLATYDAALGDTVLWDDLDTDGMVESRDERIVRAALAAVTWLEGRIGADMDSWRWGLLHTIRFEDLFGLAAFNQDIFSIPPLDDPDYPDGFPRHGDMFAVDACNFSLFDETDYTYDSGPSQRLVVELTPDGPKASNALPGGNQHDPALPHHADEAEYWRRNQAPPFAYEEIDVVQAAETRIRFVP